LGYYDTAAMDREKFKCRVLQILCAIVGLLFRSLCADFTAVNWQQAVGLCAAGVMCLEMAIGYFSV